MNKKVLIIVLVIVVILAVVFAVMKFKGGSSESPDKFGKETYKLLDDGKYILACNDAKSIVKMIRNMNEDFAKNPELAGVSDISRDNMTESMKIFESAMDNFTNTLEAKYQDNRTLRDQVFAGVGEGFSNIFQLTIMLHLGMTTVEKVDEYVEISFCGKKAPEGYLSPLEQPATPMDGGMGNPHGGAPADNGTAK